jgi:recombinational DNA repair protein RecR
MKENHQVTITSELIDKIHRQIDELDNVVHRCGMCNSILDATWFCKGCNYQHRIIPSTHD